MANIEVEFRGKLSVEQKEKLEVYLKTNGSYIKNKNRILIDYSTCIEGEDLRNRSLDIRARITNGEPEMIIKVGKWQGSDVRKEISVLLQPGQFTNLIQAYAALGYKKGVLCIRNSKIYVCNDVEYALVEVPGHSYFFEAEIEVKNESGIEEAKNKIMKQLETLGLKLFSDQEWFDYIELLNKEANVIFDIEKDGEDYFIKKFNI